MGRGPRHSAVFPNMKTVLAPALGPAGFGQVLTSDSWEQMAICSEGEHLRRGRRKKGRKEADPYEQELGADRSRPSRPPGESGA